MRYGTGILRSAAVCVCLLILGLCGCSSDRDSGSREATQELFAMDTYMSIRTYGAQAEAAAEAAVTEILRLEALWSVGDPDSEIARHNAGENVDFSEDTAGLLQRAEEYRTLTEGAFDINVYPLMEAWGFTTGEYRVPSEEEIQRLMTEREEDAIDLGGIAKGYTSGRIMEIFQKYGITSGMVSLGGNVQVYGAKPDGSDWRVGIENPDETLGQLAGSDCVGVLTIKDLAVITSGGYERYFEEAGERYHHILDPFTGYPADSGLISVTIVSPDGSLADALSTALFVMGREKALKLWREHKTSFDAVLIGADGSITVTGGLKNAFSSDLSYTIEE